MTNSTVDIIFEAKTVFTDLEHAPHRSLVKFVSGKNKGKAVLVLCDDDGEDGTNVLVMTGGDDPKILSLPWNTQVVIVSHNTKITIEAV